MIFRDFEGKPPALKGLLATDRVSELESIYRDGLLSDTLPFWISHCVDRRFGGFMFSLDRQGNVIDTDKGMWQNARFTWLLATLCCEVEERTEWLELAEHGIRFILKNGFDEDGRMFFSVTRDGRPLRKRRYLFTECFGCMALAACARALKEPELEHRAVALFDRILFYWTSPGLLPPKVIPETRSLKGLGMPMILIGVCQELRRLAANPAFDRVVDRGIEEIRRDFARPDLEALLETVGTNGEPQLDHAEGRLLVPGHGIETAWFILREAIHRKGEKNLLRLGLAILDWMWKWGWDDEYGGILYFRDVRNLPVQEYWHDMKFWWPQNEAILASLLAYALSGDRKYLDWHRMIHEWTYRHFPDREHGEWFGYLHRDGSLSSTTKGNLWKGPFHLPRMQLFCWAIVEQMKRTATAGEP